MATIDLLIESRWILPIAPHNTVLEGHALAVHQGKIVEVLPSEQAKEKYYAHQYLDLKDHALMPGMVNSHTHASMNLFRGLADDLDLMDWLNNHIWPAEGAMINPQSSAIGAKLAFAEMIRGGTTCFNDHYFFPTEIAQAANEVGLRGRVGLHMMNVPTLWAKGEDQAIAACQGVLDANHQFDLTDWSVALHATYTCGERSYAAAKRFSDDHGIPVHMHMHETPTEIEMQLKSNGARPLEHLDNMGLLNDRFNAVHMVHLNEQDLERVHNSGCHIVLCPDSNLKLASGIPMIEKMRQATPNLCIGTDGAASNNDLDMFAEMRLASCLAKATGGDPKLFPAADALEMATLRGARAMQMDDKIGSLEPGKEADIIAIDLNHLFTTPTFDPMSQLVYSANRLQVSDVWVGGSQLLKNGKFTKLNIGALLEQAAPWVDKARPFSTHKHETAPSTAS